MRKKKEIAYSRALVPIKRSLYKKIAISVVIISIIGIIAYLGKKW